MERRAIKLFFSYSHRDEDLRDQLAEHLSGLKRRKVISEWHDRKIGAGTEWAKEIDINLNAADIILLLVSSAFINSEYCWGVELERAMERHEAGEACVIPVILRPVVWQDAPFAKLQAFPTNARPVTEWQNPDAAFVNVVEGIREAVDRLMQRETSVLVDREASLPTPTIVVDDQETQDVKESGQGEEYYREEVLLCLREDGGNISQVNRIVLDRLREGLELLSERAIEIETEVSRPFQLYRQTLIDLKPQFPFTQAIRSRLKRLQNTLKLDDEDVRSIEQSVFPQVEPKPAPVIEPPKPKSLIYTFDIITVDTKGKEINRRKGQSEFIKEELGNGIILEMVSIPGGSFMMGASDGELESSNQEKPQHRVTVEPFFMGKYPVTQEQWAAIATLPKINLDLKADPSRFKGAKRPVESVSWDEAIEFCARLSKKTGKNYRLPSEAQWEYACRAKTTSPFYFGETITTELANYQGTDWKYEGTTYPGNYGNGPKGIYREHTTNVGGFPPNAFGLYDMHGNVWEWCADPWHEDYNRAPSDDRVWELDSDQENIFPLLRGGSWNNGPRNCRSAIRFRYGLDVRINFVGFRVVSSAPRAS
jgi:formylglycine-generating enzyme required for sulfatase activity